MPKPRPSPEKLLHQVQEEERLEHQGKLKIYLGAAPGVGKTYSMLQDALALRKRGLDIVIGVVESHGRQEIDEFTKKFEILPLQSVEYRGHQLKEFDLDGALKRKPSLILVDEMAHTNVPGLRHSKRWQDIKELLDRGIDVYTTLNVQHIESLNDDVSQIIHAPVKETVPDSMIEMANTIELVDLPPEELLKRLQEGKVYIPAQAELAVEHFFRKGNLIALRELALRTTAERVGTEVLLYRQDKGIKHVWPTKEKLLVCVGKGPGSRKIIRAARRNASSLQADWIAVYVDRTDLGSNRQQKRNKAIENLRFAEQLGAETRVLTGYDVVKEILLFAREQNVTQIMVWKNIDSRLRHFFHRDLADEILRQSGEIDVYIMTGTRTKLSAQKTLGETSKTTWKPYFIALGTIVSITLFNYFVSAFINARNLEMIYILGVTGVALMGSSGASIFASILSVIFYNFFLMPEVLPNLQSLISLAILLLVSLVISNLTVLIKHQAESARTTEHQTAALHNLSKQLARTRGPDNLIKVGADYIAKLFESDVLVLLPTKSGLQIRPKNKKNPLTEKEKSIAQWVYELGQKAGQGTDTLSFSKALYFPLITPQGIIGVLRIEAKSERLLTPEQIHLLEACANQLAVAVEVDRLHEQTRKHQLQAETDRARIELLKSVSKDLRTPEQLNQLINNLLQITYLEEAELELKKEENSLKDVIYDVLLFYKDKMNHRPFTIEISKTFPKFSFDKTLIETVLKNLLDNIFKFTPPETPIEIAATIKHHEAQISIADLGPGIKPADIKLLFDKFYRSRGTGDERGLGLGLAICKRIIEAHGGRIWVENRKQGGAVFHFTLPMDDTNTTIE